MGNPGWSHTIGSCHSDGNQVYVNIPKNASTSVKAALPGWEYTEKWVNRMCRLPGFAVIRDPIGRWFSGVHQYANRHFLSHQLLLQRVVDGRPPVFDEHTMRQTDFLVSTFPGLELVPMEHLQRWFSERFEVELPRRNPSQVEHDPRVVPILREFYADDIELHGGLLG